MGENALAAIDLILHTAHAVAALAHGIYSILPELEEMNSRAGLWESDSGLCGARTSKLAEDE